MWALVISMVWLIIWFGVAKLANRWSDRRCDQDTLGLICPSEFLPF